MNVDITISIGIKAVCVCVHSVMSDSFVSDSLQLHELYCSLLDSCVHGISQARMLHWVAIPFSTVNIAQT